MTEWGMIEIPEVKALANGRVFDVRPMIGDESKSRG